MSEWKPLSALPDLRHVDIIALDTETKDGGLLTGRGSGWAFNDGYICGISIAYRAEGTIRAHYFPLRHPDTQNFDREQLLQWLRDLITSDVRIVTQNGLYDWGWLRADAGVVMPPSERLEEIGALATMVDENRYRYSLDALCTWRGLSGKDEMLLKEGAAALGFPKKAKLATLIWQLPARFVGPYAEADAVNTLALFESLDPVLDQEGTRNAYRLEVDLLPMVHEMRRRGIRIDTAAAEHARDLLLCKRDATFAELSEKLGANIGMAEIGRTAWLAETFDQQGIKYPRTEKGNPSFTAGTTGWMHKHKHWLPRLIATADKYNNAAVNFLETYILGHVVNGRVHAEIHPHRSDEGGTRSLRFSYSSPPLQLMPAHDEELAPLIRGVFLPEPDEVWAKPDISQQEFRLIVHYAARHGLRGANEAAERYRNDPNTDFHVLVSTMTGRDRQISKSTNFARAFGARVRKFAAMIGKPISEAEAIYEQYDRELPFVSELSKLCERAVRRKGYLTLYDGARRHWTDWAPGGKWKKGLGPCPREEAEERVRDPDHPWFRKQLWLANTRKAMNALIQGSAARHTKLWMRACWREGIIPLLQMHDALDCSVSSPEQAELVAQLGREAVKLEVPMQIDLAFGRTWGDAKHSWEERYAAPEKSTTTSASTAPPPQDDFDVDLGDVDDEPIDREEELPLHQTDWGEVLERDFPHAKPAFTAAATESAHQEQQADPQPRATRHDDGNGYDNDYRCGEAPKGSSSAQYIYKDERGSFYMKVVRTTAKTFPTYHWKSGDWVKGWPEKVIPYRLPELIVAPASEPVWVCEGEKDANNVAALGLIATTNPGGAKNWQPELAQWFKRKELVYILEDNDDDGRKHTSLIINALRDIVPTIAVVSFPELAKKGDVSDWFEQGGNKQLLLARAEQARKQSTNKNYVLVRASDIVPRPMDWLWEGHILRGSQELLTGIPGTGKSQIHCALIAAATTGGLWPDGANGVPAGNVIMLTAEDCLDQTIIPRLIVAGANRDRVFVLRKIRKDNKERMFLLNEDLEELERIIKDTGDVRLITIDPITAYMGGGKNFDSHRATDVRGQLGPLADLAERLDVALSAITHPPKHSTQRAIDHFIGSQAYIAAARIGHMAVEEYEADESGHNQPTGRSLFTNPKNNMVRKMPTLAYRVVEQELDGGVKAARVMWEDIVDITADQAVAAATPSKRKDQSGPIVFLQAILTNGPVLKNIIEQRGAECGFSADQLKRAKQKLNVVTFKETGKIHGQWFWALPEDAPTGGTKH
jgi:DNA polymerase I-like protein with 3'-5' exonuclease and polymerase domains